MSYISIQFCIFVVVLVILYYLLPKFQKKILLLASACFYCLFGIKYIVFLLFVAISTFMCAKVLEYEKRKTIIFACILSNVTVWTLIKAFPWWLSVANRILDISLLHNISSTLSIIVPIGISYYTLQAIGYLVDVYKDKTPAEKNFATYLLFLSYFPAIVQGPISRYNNLVPQFENIKAFDYDKTRKWLLLIIFGLIKKLVIADQLAIFANTIFDNYDIYQGIILYIAGIAYTIQLYMDFSGCVDICRGVSGLFGINLVDNFNTPYFARSIKDFWRRWHISLSSWLKDYVYIPLGGSRGGKISKYRNLIITFLVSGIWHGQGFTFIAWGLLQAVYQIVGEETLRFRNYVKNLLRIEKDSFSDKFYQIVITFNLSVFSWIIFRSNSFMGMIGYFKNMFSTPALWQLFDGSVYNYGLNRETCFIVFVNICLVFIYELMKVSKNIDVKDKILSLHGILRWSIYFMLCLNVILFGAYGTGYDLSGFLYGGF